MAFFKFRFPGAARKQAAAPAAAQQGPTESVEALRRRARHRLIGAAVLVLVGVVGFPLLFDTQPRPVAVDIPIDIPDRNAARPLVQPPPAASASAPAAGPTLREPQVAQAPVAAPAPAAAPATPAPAPVPTPVTEAPTRAPEPAAKATPAPTPAPAPAPSRTADAARAQALLEGRSAPAPAVAAASESGRFVVQVGAFSDDSKMREARTKVERAGLKTFIQTVDTKDGKRTRVRVGPFASRAEADKAATRIKGLDLPAAVLTL